MQLTRVLVASTLLCLATGAVARADDSTPPPPQVTSSPVVVPPTSAPIVDTPAPAPASSSTPAPDSSPVPVAPETNPTVKVNEPAVSPSAVGTATAPTDQGPPQPSTPSPVIIPPQQVAPPPHASSSQPAPTASSPQSPPVQTDSSLPPLLDGSSGTTSAAAPSELTCHGQPKPTADPFMVSPYSGWADVNSFLDHDSPDYSVDGKIVISNGLTATDSDGVSSDFFPAYWSSALRQYINYDGHNGYDFGISYQPVLAAASGVVRFAGWTDSGYGDMILIDHRNGYITLYGHLSKLEVNAGDKVNASEEIGISGSTGRSTGPHLHFSVFHNCQVTDPYGWTGHGTDPLQAFDGETGSYLWLPGEDPLILNPPPNWPAFPLGLKIPGDRIAQLHQRGLRTLPPADRLLLLRLPVSPSSTPVSPTVALARTEAQVTQEAEAISPYLQDLQAEGLITSYQVMPAAAAIWERGTATAAQLEGLPGVASLAGGQPRDLSAAQVGLAHSILIQIGRGQAPSLWPVGFRSALNNWRPTVAVSVGHALLAGFSRPGQSVSVVLKRGDSIPGATQALAEPDSGGFVAMIHDRLGNPVPIRPGDVIQVESEGRTAQLRVVSFSIQARAHLISGRSQSGVTVPLALIPPTGGRVWDGVTAVDGQGRFALSPRTQLSAGSLLVATVADAAGDQEAATAYVPGINVVEGGSTVHGWTVGASPRLRVVRRGRLIVAQEVHPAPDGTFEAELTSRERSVRLEAGDIVSIGSPWHQRRFTLPKLSLSMPAGATTILVVGPPGTSIHAICYQAGVRSWTRLVHLDAAGRGLLRWPGAWTSVGDSVTAQVVTATGDLVEAGQEARGILIHAGESTVSGRVRPGTTLRIHALSSSGRPVGAAVTVSDPVSGNFSARLVDASGAFVRIQPAMRLEIRDAAAEAVVRVPSISMTVSSKSVQLKAGLAPGTSASLSLFDRKNRHQLRRLRANAAGEIILDLHFARSAALIKRAIFVVPGSQGLSVERDLLVSHPAIQPLKKRNSRPSTGR